MPTTTTTKRSTFRTLHDQGCFILPNPWDAGSARLLQHTGFSALASTSSGYAWTGYVRLTLLYGRKSELLLPWTFLAA